ncbi:MAG: hypothetical protein JWM63_2744 [Gammaproteobacteria bacterium]|jgi:hypothetical protein|nr:hypothetical protein [Gammaproteobacteria bacterium]
MTPVIVALYDDYGIATRVRTQLVADGFATDRVEVTSRLEAGQADAEPGDAFGERVANYFHTIFDQNQEQAQAEDFAARVLKGASAVTVHPRADYEIASARKILQQNKPAKLEELLG